MLIFRANLIIFIFASLSSTNCSFFNPEDEFTSRNDSIYHTISKRQSQKSKVAVSCEVPTGSLEQVYNIYDSNHELITDGHARSSAPQFSVVESQCATGYLFLDGSNTSASFCSHTGAWVPSLKSCHRVCPILQASNVVPTCKDKRGGFIDCNSPLLTSGTQVTAHCLPLYQVDPLSRSDSDFIQCRDDGRWDRELIKCVPECGIPLHQPLIANGSEAQYGEFPWHVAIYRVSIGNKYICGGTLITTNMVLSAAHCFYNETRSRPNRDPEDYEIFVGKMTSDYDRVDNNQQQKLKISRIQFAVNEYNPSLSYASDIAIVILKENATISQYVLPACFRRPERYGNFRPQADSIGALPGWGLDENDRVSTTLKMALLPFMDYNTCAKKVAHVTIDKFCAGADPGPRPLQGDSGGGLVFKEGLFYYVRGIVSTRGKWSDSSLTTFTDLSFYQDWIESVIQQGALEQGVTAVLSSTRPTSSTSKITTQRPKYTTTTTLKPARRPAPTTAMPIKNGSIPDERCKAWSTSKLVWSCKQVADCKSSAKLLSTSQDYRCGPRKEKICCPETKSPQPQNHTQTVNQRDGCEVPARSAGRVFSITDKNFEPLFDPKAGSLVPKFALIDIECREGYALSDGSKTSASYCDYKGEWDPRLKSCHRACPALRTSSDLVLTCKDKDGAVIDCHGPLLFKGTQVTAHCKPPQEVDTSFRSGSDLIQCRDNGRWDKELIKCVTREVECRVPAQSADRVITLTSTDFDHGFKLDEAPGSWVPKFTLIDIECSKGYVLSDGSSTLSSKCDGTGEWDPRLEPCQSKSS